MREKGEEKMCGELPDFHFIIPVSSVARHYVLGIFRYDEKKIRFRLKYFFLNIYYNSQEKTYD